ncbi:hypothetical protein PVK06_046164 [Gossypium arboreum]|uniref:50S ribosomal protein 5, chloroplastic n=1 Tax=Gossypium arboreum TaxID=29729 RepID=A0ABR0MBR3_GOSAR|nr:hypothetical protein PVK06_046164 [Gossypium arboreum]
MAMALLSFNPLHCLLSSPVSSCTTFLPIAVLPKETKKEALPVEQLPLESKMQQIMEQKMKMKLAKKIRLPRKRLVCKRKMREKGRWPPSKMKKLKNV